jgi:GrpB-like predicted nucleotidyltransferase (UPF0157 family)
MRVLVSKPDSTWPTQFLLEAALIRETAKTGIVDIHHIGSTAIPNIFAKPIIDILLIVADLHALDKLAIAMQQLGYEAKGEFGIAGRRYFRKNSNDGARTHQVHAFELGSAHINRHLAFRDYIRSHPDIAASYSELKRRLADQHFDDIAAYMNDKDAFIKRYEAEALQWQIDPTRPRLGG